MKRILTSFASALVALSILATANAAAPSKLQIKIGALNGSGERGTAILQQMPKGVFVTVNLAGNTAAQPTHIHAGNCGHINASPEWPLNVTKNGTSKTLVPGVTISQMLASHYAINIHKSLTDLKDYVACGNIRS
ncbi:MAG TPA: hypothetical protein VMV73_00965 [Candidatus Dormibacteraeota bacterium]|nr:hypothetical protein [Candidatus Dormibacteraeota bacterium]